MIAIEANTPPGKRCNLYLRYAEKIGQQTGKPFTVTFHPARCEQERITPWISLDGKRIEPADGQTLSPTDIVTALGGGNDELLAGLREVYAGATVS